MGVGLYIIEYLGRTFSFIFCLHQPSYSPGFKSQANIYLCFFQFVFQLWCEKDKSVHKKRPGLASIWFNKLFTCFWMAHFRQIVSFDEMTKMRMIFDRKIKQLHAPSLSSLLSSQISFRLKCKINQLMAVVVVVSVVTFCSHNHCSNCSCCHLQFWKGRK